MGLYHNAQVITFLNHAGLSSSYYSTWEHLKRLTDEARFLQLIKIDHWLWIYDNLNFYQTVRHEREG